MQVIDVPASDGALWIKSAFKLFLAQPLGWLGLVGAWFLICLLLLIVPFIGLGIMHVLRPVFFAGFMLACRDQEAGKPVTPSYLFAAFRAGPLTLRPLMMLGAIGLFVGALISLGLVAIGLPTIPQDMKSVADILAYRAALMDSVGILVLGFVLSIVEMGIFWFAAPLLAFKPMPVSHAIRWSFFAFLSNVTPLLLFAILMFVLCFLASIPLLLGMIVWAPIFAITNYTSYQRVFKETSAE